MKHERDPIVLASVFTLEPAPGYLSVKEAAQILGLSERAVYTYVKDGRLPGERIGDIMMVRAKDVAGFERKAPGRIRTTTPLWHRPPQKNLQYVTTITVRMYPEQERLFRRRLDEIRVARKHHFPGTCARSIVRNERDPEEITLVLVWRGVVMPPLEVREASLVAFFADLADVLDWETAVVKEGQVLLHA